MIKITDLVLAIGIMIAIVLLLLGAVIPQDTTAQLSSDERPLGDYLEFPEGWELVSSHAHAYQSTGPFVVYVCRNIETGEYRTCNPTIRPAVNE